MRPFICFLLLLASLCGNARTWYFSAAGNDAANGLMPATAWKSLSKMYSVTPTAGDSLLFRGGDAFSGLLYLGPASCGTAAHPLVIGSFSSGRATLNGGKGQAIFCYNNGGMLIKNLNLVGDADSLNTGSGVYFYTDTPGMVKLPVILMDSLSVAGFGREGIEVAAYPKDSSRSGWKGVRITHVDAHENGNAGIMVAGNYKITDAAYNHTNLYIGHCSTFNNRGIGGGINGSGIEVSQTDSAIIEYCGAYNNGTTGGGGVGIWAWDANRVIIQHCESHHNHTTRSDGDGFDLDGGVTNSILQYNYSHDNDGAGFLLWQFDGARPWRNNVVRYNISENDSRKHSGYYGIIAVGMGDTSVNSGVHEALVYNNTCYKNRIPGNDTAQGPAVSLDGENITGIKVCNNIFMLSGTIRFVTDYYNADAFFLNNDYRSTSGFWVQKGAVNYYSAASWTAATGQEHPGTGTHARFADPRFGSLGTAGTIGNADSLVKLRAYYSLAAASPMIDSGINLLGLYSINTGTQDFFGNAIPAGRGYDVGAMEYPAPNGITAVAPVLEYHAYPVPCDEYVVVNADGAAVVYDASGRALSRTVLSSEHRIDMSAFPAGAYLIVVESPAGQGFARVTKR